MTLPRHLTPSVLLGLLLLFLAGCQPQVKVVRVDQPVFIPPPAACLGAVDWDPDFDPYGLPGDALIRSWARRGAALEEAGIMLQCIKDWAGDAEAALPRLGTGQGEGR